MTKILFYTRVSTTTQTVENQVDQAADAGYVFDQVLSDSGVSGVSTKLQDRPQGKRLFDLLRAGDILVVRWLDRLGRDYDDITMNMRQLINTGVIIKTLTNAMIFDGTINDPLQKALRDAQIAMLAAIAQAETEAKKDAQQYGIERAKKENKYTGRHPTIDSKKVKQLKAEVGASEAARQLGISRASIYRLSRP